MAVEDEKNNGVLQLEKADSSDDGDGRFDENAATPGRDWTPEEERKLV